MKDDNRDNHGSNDNDLVERIYQDLRNGIVQETIKPDQKLSETTLSRSYNCSRTPIREAFKRLQYEGLLLTIPKSGTYVRKETPAQLVEIEQVRTYLEKLAFRLAIKTITPRELAEQAERVEKMQHLLDQPTFSPREFSEVHFAYHRGLIEASRNDLLCRTFDGLNLRYSNLFQEGAGTSMAVVRTSNREHALILEALKAGDCALGEDLIETHLWKHKKIRNKYPVDL